MFLCCVGNHAKYHVVVRQGGGDHVLRVGRGIAQCPNSKSGISVGLILFYSMYPFFSTTTHPHMECIPDSLKVCVWEGGVAVGCVGGGSASKTSFTLTSERLGDYLVLRLSQRSVVVRLHERQLFILIGC